MRTKTVLSCNKWVKTTELSRAFLLHSQCQMWATCGPSHTTGYAYSNNYWHTKKRLGPLYCFTFCCQIFTAFVFVFKLVKRWLPAATAPSKWKRVLDFVWVVGEAFWLFKSNNLRQTQDRHRWGAFTQAGVGLTQMELCCQWDAFVA